MREGIPVARLTMTAIAAFGAGIAIYFFVPIGRAEQDELSIGKHSVTANFPCRPKLRKHGGDDPRDSLDCSQGGVTYSLSANEYSEQAPADAWASGILDDVRSQPNVTLKSSTRLSHESFPAIRMHFSMPRIDMVRFSVLTDAGVIRIDASWPSGSPEPSPVTTFTSSLTIKSVKK